MATEKETLKLDLDISGLVGKANEAKEAITALGDAENLKGLATAMRGMLPELMIVAAAVYAVKKAIDFVEEAEQINQINAQFEAMAGSLGIAADAMKNKLMVATRGLIDDTDALKVANQAFVALGDQAGKLPEIFEIARKSVAVFGGDMISRVEQISTALASGNIRALRSIGINVDMDKAMKDYARSIGVTVDMLTEQEKKQILSNAALDQARQKFKGVNEDLKPVTNSLQQMKVAWSNIGETVLMVFNKTIGPMIKWYTGLIKEASTVTKIFFKERLGDDAEKAEAKLEKTQRRMEAIKEEIASVQKQEARWGVTVAWETRIKNLRAEYAALDEQVKKTMPAGPTEAAGAAEPTLGGIGKSRANEMAEHRMGLISQIRQLEYQAAQGMQNEEAAKAAYITALQDEAQAKITALRAKDSADVKNKAEQEILIRKQAEAKIEAVQKESAAKQKKNYQDLISSMKAGNAALTVGLVAGFKSLSKGGKEAAKAMKAAFLNMLADRAEGEGQLKIASGLFPPNPGLLASGAALLALSGVLRGAAGGGEGGGVGGGGGGGGIAGPSAVAAEAAQDTRPNVGATAQRGRSVTIAIAGNYFETEQTRRALMEMVRQETDATAFQYVQIPQGTA